MADFVCKYGQTSLPMTLTSTQDFLTDATGCKVVCEHLSRGEVVEIDASPTSGTELLAALTDDDWNPDNDPPLRTGLYRCYAEGQESGGATFRLPDDGYLVWEVQEVFA